MPPEILDKKEVAALRHDLRRLHADMVAALCQAYPRMRARQILNRVRQRMIHFYNVDPENLK